MKSLLFSTGIVLLLLSCNKESQESKADNASMSQQLSLSKIGPHGGTPFSITLEGETRGGIPGDPDGTGTFYMTLNQGQGEVSYVLKVANIAPSTAAHIHRAPVGAAGPLVFGLLPPTNGISSGTIQVSPEIIKEIRQNPSAFYVNVHNSPYPAGAVGGQLSK